LVGASQFLSLSNYSTGEILRIERYSGGNLQSFSKSSPSATTEIPPNHPGINGSVKVKIERVGNVGRTWYDTGSGYILDKEFVNVYPGSGTVEIAGLNSGVFPISTAVFDNFTAKVNFVN
jgi:hypothetical protein